jgi:cytochrome c biogenesis protein CcmG/thiol:disulfide interchange protein DsbE
VSEGVVEKSSNRTVKVVIWGAVFVVLALLGWGLMRRSESRPQVGSQAPNFTLSIFDGYHNEFNDGQLTLADLKGRVAVINFWASWCVECRVEAKELEATWQSYRDQGVVFIGVDFDDTETKARQYLESFGITYPNGLDGRGRISDDSYHITGVPETFIVDPTGEISFVKIGPFTPGELQRQLDLVLE